MTNIINFVNLTLEEKKLVLQMRNHASIKSVMHDSNNISLKDHLSFIESLKKHSTKKYFLVKENEIYIGVIDFINITTKSAELGIYVNPTLRGKGIILLDILCTYAFDSMNLDFLQAQVYEENEKALNLYKEFQFKETSQTILHNKKIINMELNNENR